MNLNITIEATANSCDITINGIKRQYIRTGTGSSKGLQTGDWEDDIENGLIPEAFEPVISRLDFMPLDAMQACEEADYDE